MADAPSARCGQRQHVMTPENGAQSALYIASIVGELARLAKSHHLDALAYILDMARLEADQAAKGAGPEEPPDADGSD